MIVDLVSRFIEETRGHPLGVTVPEAQLLHDFATWADSQSTQQGASAELPIVHCEGCGCKLSGDPVNLCYDCNPAIG